MYVYNNSHIFLLLVRSLVWYVRHTTPPLPHTHTQYFTSMDMLLYAQDILQGFYCQHMLGNLNSRVQHPVARVLVVSSILLLILKKHT
jgi:hypothetical protein